MQKTGMRTHLASEERIGLHHECRSCGGSCQGAVVSMMDEAEVERMNQLGRQLNIENPVIGGRLRQDMGRCVFLASDFGCRIHAHAGWENKPTLCKQFPVVAIRVDDQIRVGVDPACYHSWKGWESGPPVDMRSIVVGQVVRSESETALENRLVHFCESGTATVGSLAHWLCGVRPEEGRQLPGFLGPNIWKCLKIADLPKVLANDGYPLAIREAIEPILVALEATSDFPDSFFVGGVEDEWSVEAVRRLLYLRMTHGIPTVAGACLLMMMGIVACLAIGLKGEAYCFALAGWFRLLRFPDFWPHLVADSAAMARIVTPPR